MSHAEWSLVAQDFRALRNVRWNPSGVCLLSGPNGSGKSSLLQALQFLRDAASRGIPEAVRLVGGGALVRRLGAEPKAPVRLELCIGDLRWEIQIPVEGGSIHPSFGEVIEHGGNVLAQRAMYSGDVFLGSEQRKADNRSVLQMLWDVHSPPEIEPMMELARGIRVYGSYCLDQIREPQSGTDVDDYLHASGKNVWNVLRTWSAAPRKYRDQFGWLVKALRSAFPDLVVDLEFDLVGQTVVGRFYPPNARSAEDSLPLSLAADGLLVGILHLTAIAGAKKGSIVAIDEMENQLHPHAIRSILDSMRAMAEERELTILLTTHSPVVMNTFKGREDQFYVLEAGHEVLPIPLDEALDPDWLAHFSSLGDLYDREDFAAPVHPAPSSGAE
jgi:predicted ATPase